jgi:hypothetical protein
MSVRFARRPTLMTTDFFVTADSALAIAMGGGEDRGLRIRLRRDFGRPASWALTSGEGPVEGRCCDGKGPTN